VDDFERKDRRSSLDTLRLETGDGGMDRTVEITQTVRVMVADRRCCYRPKWR
jgi:hypothetical protein